MAEHPRVAGNCPMGCGQTLFLGSGGHVTCSYLGCPEPGAVSDLLAESETLHIVEFKDDSGWTLQHPLKDRVEGILFGCPAILVLQALDGPPVQPGRYRMHPRKSAPGGQSYRFVPMDSAQVRRA